MNGMLEIVADVVRKNAIAGAASVKGSYESKVPATRKKAK